MGNAFFSLGNSGFGVNLLPSVAAKKLKPNICGREGASVWVSPAGATPPGRKPQTHLMGQIALTFGTTF